MNSRQILTCMKQDTLTRDAFRGVFASDLIAKHGKFIQGQDNSYVCNTGDSATKGEHWIAIYINSKGVGEYFDSYGLSPLRVFSDFLKDNSSTWTKCNETALQSPLSTVCGQYCIYWLHCKGQGYSSQTIIDNLDVCNGDTFVLDFVNKHFSGQRTMQLMDRQFMKEQISLALSSLS